VDRITRHDLKTDKFVEEVAHSVEYLDVHRSQVIRYGAIALAVLVAAGGTWWFMQSRKAERQTALYEAIETYNTRVSTGSVPQGMKIFRTEAERNATIAKDLGALVQKYSGSDEAAVATYLLGVNAADQGNIADASRYLKQAAEGGNADYASLAKLSLADIYVAEGKTADAEKLAREIVAKPTTLVSKDQASLALARIIAKTKPDEARKLLEPMRTTNGASSRVAIQAMADLGLVK
jgi:predicted negative regulator of RcsB-dependent stress response